MFRHVISWTLLVVSVMGALPGVTSVYEGTVVAREGDSAVFRCRYYGWPPYITGTVGSSFGGIECMFYKAFTAPGVFYDGCSSHDDLIIVVKEFSDFIVITLTLSNVKQSYNGELRLYVGGRQKIIEVRWTFYVLGPGTVPYMENTYLVQSGDTVNLKDFPRPSKTMTEYSTRNYNMTETWIFDGNQHYSTLDINKEFNNKNLLYVIADTYGTATVCFILSVMSTPQIRRHTNGTYLVREGLSIRVTNFPHLLPGTLKRLNVTEQWYLNEKAVTSQSITVDREVKSSVLAYVITDESLKSARFDYNIATAYGPSRNATFTPRQSVHIVKHGASIPTIRCEVDCFPCGIVWSKDGVILSETNTLSLGQATSSTTGEYICTAWNNVTNLWTTKSLFIYTEEPDKGTIQKIIFYVLVAVLTLTCVVFVILLIRMKRQRDKRDNVRGNPILKLDDISQQAPESPTGELPTYINLLIGTGAQAESNNHPLATDSSGQVCSEAVTNSRAPPGEVPINEYMDLIRTADAQAESHYTALQTGNLGDSGKPSSVILYDYETPVNTKKV